MVVPNEVLPGPGEWHGVAAGVSEKGVGAERLGQGNPPEKVKSSSTPLRRLTLNDNSLDSALTAPHLPSGNHSRVNQMGRECQLLRWIVVRIQPNIRSFVRDSVCVTYHLTSVGLIARRTSAKASMRSS